mgnify:CR=1 FL=1
MYDSGKSSMDIKMFLDKQIDIEPRRTSLGWNLGTIQKMLRNPLYKGEQIWVWREKLPNVIVLEQYLYRKKIKIHLAFSASN